MGIARGVIAGSGAGAGTGILYVSSRGVGPKYTCVSHVTPAQISTAAATPATVYAAPRTMRRNGECRLKRPYPSVCRTASVCAALPLTRGVARGLPRRNASRMIDI